MPMPSPLDPAAPSVTIPLDGMAEVPNGTIVAIVTFMECRTPPPLADGPRVDLVPIGSGEPQRFRRLFRDVGQPWLWTSRLSRTDDEIAERLATPGIETHAMQVDGVDVGVVETDGRHADAHEVVLFGFVPEATGRRLGPGAFSRIVRSGFARPGVDRVWLHTCTLDHPKAVGFYRSFGFRALRRAIEIVPDPRLSGLMPADAAPDHPICAP